MADIQKTIKELQDWIDCPFPLDTSIEPHIVHDCLELLKEQPEIVRCKDCRYAHGTITDVARCMKNKNRLNEYHPLNWYCADGIRTDTPRGSAEYGTQETKRIKKIIWEVLHGGYSIDTPVDQDWVSTKIFLLIDGCGEEEADNVADVTRK